MFFSVIAAYVIATAFAFCGVVGMATCIGAADRTQGYAVFLSELVVSMWPLAVAMVIVLLTQIACLVEKWLLLWQIAQGSATQASPENKAAAAPNGKAPAASAFSTPKVRANDKPAPSYFPCENIESVTPPLLSREDEKRMKEQKTAETETAGAPERASAATAPATPPAPKKEEGLSFFKLD